MKFSEKFFSFIYPHKCSFCHKGINYENNTFICDNCASSLPFIKGKKCIRCNKPIPPYSLDECYTCRNYKYSFLASYTPLLYKNSVRASLLGMKFYNKESFTRSYAYLICDYIISQDYPLFDFITYVPLSPSSYKKRGYNQSALIAKWCGEHLNTEVIPTLRRIDGTPKQSALSFRERRKNVRKSFFPTDKKLSGTALLIDDIYTTGATVDYCSSLLLKMGCEKVYIAAVALKENY